MMLRQLSMPARRPMRLLLTFAALGVLGLLTGGAFLWVALGAAEEDAYSFCVGQNGNVRLLSQSAKPGDAPVDCRRNERLIEVPSEARIADLEAAFGALGASLADVLAALGLAEAERGALQGALDGLEGRVTTLENPPTPTPTPTPVPTPTGTPLPPLQQQVIDILGPTGVILPLTDPSDPSRFTTIGAAAAVFTWSPGPFGTPASVLGPAGIPIITFNGTDEVAVSPDADFWSVDDSSDAGFSLGMWARLTPTPTNVTLLSKWGASGNREWTWDISTVDRMELFLSDDSVGASSVRRGNVAVSQGQWVFLVITYDGMGGASATDGITLYVDGAVHASIATNDASYVGMENGSEPVTLAAEGRGGTPGNFFNGKMAGGPLGPWFVTHDAAGIITAAQVAELYVLGRDALGLP